MKPLRLVMQAFGPYASASEIDFGELGRGGLFLIHGQTGAGKTSILDGICFALFGKSSGADRAGEGLRSDLASAALATEVVFEFTLGADSFRVVRRPRQMLKRVRGEGLAQQLPKGELWKKGRDDWELLTSGDKKTDERIGQLIGMTEEQFRQVVVLPQGQFRKFLSSSSDAREKLLEALFRTEKYRRLAEHLGEKATALHSDIDAQKQALAAQLTALEISGHDELRTRLDEARTLAARLETSAADLDARLTSANERLRSAERYAKVNAELAALTAREARLNEGLEEIRAVTEKLDRDRRSRPVLAILASMAQHERDLARLQTALVKEQGQLAQAEKELGHALERRRALETRTAEIEILKAEQQTLRDIYAAAKKLRTEQDGLAAVESQAHVAAANVREIDLRKEAGLRERTENTESIRALDIRLERLETARAERRDLQIEHDLLRDEIRDIEQAAFQLERAESFRVDTKAAWVSERAVLTKLRVGYHLSQAAILSAELTPGEPCPVCGSSAHPRPATAALDREYGPDAITSAELALERASMRHASAEERASAATELLTNATARTAKRFTELGDRDLASVARAALETASVTMAELDRVIADGEEAMREKRTTQTRIAALETELSKLDIEARSAVARQEEARLRLEAAKTRVASLEAQVPPDRRDLESITARGQKLKTETDAFAKFLNEALEHHDRTSRGATTSKANIETFTSEIAQKNRDLQVQSNECDALLATSGFASLDECRAAGLAGHEARELEERRRTYDDERAIVLSRIGELRHEFGAFAEWAHDLQARADEQRAADRARSESHGQTLALKERIAQLDSAHVRIEQLGRTITALEDKFKVVGRLGQVAAGQPPHNLSRVNFARFVLASRLDDVLDLASRRLYSMSRGQFTLRRALVGADKRKNAGLDLEVEDAHSGSTRPTSSLSGGEGFMASLALALGLADVVQNELGGVRLDAVFVDEGFGTLDSEALELAMKTLAELQAGGRIVGVISHVPELKDQIARRLLVRKTPSGSHVGWESSPSL